MESVTHNTAVTHSCLRTIERKHYQIIELLSGFETNGTKALEPVINKILSNPKHAALNCAGVLEMPDDVVETIHFLDQQLKSAGKKVRLVYVDQKLRTQLKSSRFGAFLIISEFLPALDDFASEETDVSSKQFIKAFVNATLRTFYVQAKVQCRRGDIFLKKDNQNELLGDIAGLVKVTTKAFPYAVILSFPKNTFLKLMNRLLGESYSEISAENQDGATEFMNIIFGQAKLVLNRTGADVKPQVPTLNVGRDMAGLLFEDSNDLVRLDSGKMIVLPFESEIGQFFIEVWVPAAFRSILL
ncbi:MAG TPA: chemotaxis protein CheX [Bdellovibrionota bacterium]|nr:chemotaxis protein CheX [Bdellovibrionota bacterium]